MENPVQSPRRTTIELEVIACSLDDALAAYHGGASRLEVTIGLDRAGLTPPMDLVREIIDRVPLPLRVMLRDRPDFLPGSHAEIERLNQEAKAFAALNIDGLVTGHLNGTALDLRLLEEIISAAPSLRLTVHHAVEATRDPLETLRVLRTLPNVDRALVSGGPGNPASRSERLKQLAAAWGGRRRLVAGGNLTLEMLQPLRDATGTQAFHLGRAVRTPEEAAGRVDCEKVHRAMDLLRAP